jgi:AcrR family transcriptional regulator
MPPRKGQRQVRGLARQQQIVEAAFALFAAHGSRATTLATVAAAAGLSEPGLLHYFPSKNALLRAVLAYRSELAHGEPVGPDDQAPVGGLRILHILAASARTLEANPMLARFDAVVGGESLAVDGPPAEHLRDRLRLVRARIEDALQSGVDRGEIVPEVNVADVALEVVAFLDGIQTLWLLDPEVIVLSMAYERFFTQLEERLVNHSATAASAPPH